MKHFLTFAALVIATACFGQEACPNVHDINSNGTIDIEDFLSILGLFADVDVDGDGVWDSQDDCLDATACNYLASPTEPCGYLDALGECGGACEGDGDGDGICDDVDTCVGELDECGVCNGPGPTEVVVEEVIVLYDSVYADQIDQWFVFELGIDTVFSYECAPFTCGNPLGYHGYDYQTVLIGDQCWFAENLQSAYYSNGDPIPGNIPQAVWNTLDEGAQGVLGDNGGCGGYHQNFDVIECDPDEALQLFGRLYNWYATIDGRGLCPHGWHVPTDVEINSLEVFLGLTEEEALETGSRGTHGSEMKSVDGWYAGCVPNNLSGFAFEAGGGRDGSGYGYVGNNGYFWSSSEVDDTHAWNRLLFFNDCGVRRNNYYSKNDGYSVRCLKDSE